METNKSDSRSTGSVIRDVIDSTRELAQTEISLAKADFSESVKALGKHSAKAALFGGVLAVSILPFLAFLVIGLGDLMDGRYWLSSLIVALVCAVVGGTMAARAFNELKNDDLTLPHARHGLEREFRVVQEKVSELKHPTHRRNV